MSLFIPSNLRLTFIQAPLIQGPSDKDNPEADTATSFTRSCYNLRLDMHVRVLMTVWTDLIHCVVANDTIPSQLNNTTEKRKKTENKRPDTKSRQLIIRHGNCSRPSHASPISSSSCSSVLMVSCSSWQTRLPNVGAARKEPSLLLALHCVLPFRHMDFRLSLPISSSVRL